METACQAFGCQPYFAIVVDAAERISAWIVPRGRFLELRQWKSRGHVYWKMGKQRLAEYSTIPTFARLSLSHE